MTDFSPRVERVHPSLTLQINAEAAAMERGGENVVRFGAGEPDFDTPEFIRHAAHQAIDQGFTRYTAVDGFSGLKAAIQWKFSRDNHLDFSADQIMVTCGAKQALYDICQCLVRVGDEVLIPRPYWVSYPGMVQLAEGTPVFFDLDAARGFALDAARLDGAITPRTRLLILNSPHNPTGRVFSQRELLEAGEVLRRHPHVWVVTDEIYEHIRWRGETLPGFVKLNPDLADRCLVVNGVSKAYAMTGWRVGFAAGPADVIARMTKLQGQSTAGTCTVSQHAAAAALTGDQDVVREMVAAFHERHQRIVPALDALPGVRCQPGEGTFYAFADFREAMDERDERDDVAFGERLLEEAEVAMVPGSAFGAPGFMRVSFATSMAAVEEGVARLHRYLACH